MRRSVLEQAKDVLARQPQQQSRKALAEGMQSLSVAREALVLGHLHACCNCRHFNFAEKPEVPGACRRFNVECWPFVPFWCVGFEVSPTPAARQFLPDANASAVHGRQHAK